MRRLLGTNTQSSTNEALHYTARPDGLFALRAHPLGVAAVPADGKAGAADLVPTAPEIISGYSELKIIGFRNLPRYTKGQIPRRNRQSRCP